MQLALEDFAQRAVSPFVELGAYEALWGKARKRPSKHWRICLPNVKVRCLRISIRA